MDADHPAGQGSPDGHQRYPDDRSGHAGRPPDRDGSGRSGRVDRSTGGTGRGRERVTAGEGALTLPTPHREREAVAMDRKTTGARTLFGLSIVLVNSLLVLACSGGGGEQQLLEKY